MKQTKKETGTSKRLENAICDLQALQQVLLAGDLDARVLEEFRIALNSIRNTAWAAQQLVASQLSDTGPESVKSLLASERIRTAYRLCHTIISDLRADDIHYQKGQLSELYSASSELSAILKNNVS